MKRKLSSLFVPFFCLPLLMLAQKLPTDLTIMNLQGSVKSITDKSYDASKAGAKTGKEENSVDEYDFNSSGFLTRKKETFTNCDPCKYEYVSAGKKKTITYYEENELNVKVTVSYINKAGMLVEQQKDEDDDLWDETAYKFDDAGRIIEELKFKDENHQKIESRIRYKYDAKGRLTEMTGEELNDKTGKLKITEKKMVTAFDQNGNETQVLTYDENNKLLSKVTHEYNYDSKKNWIKQFSAAIVYDDKPSDIYQITYRTISYY